MTTWSCDTKAIKALLNKFIYDMSSDDYHGLSGVLSSTQLKDAIKDDELFIRKHITKEIPRESNDAFDLGTYLHTAVLEPEKLAKECVVFPGKIKRGPTWDKFKKKHKRKLIINSKQSETAKRLISEVKKSKYADKYLKGKKEVTLIVEINVYKGEIYAPYFGMKLDLKLGWVKGPVKRFKDAYVIYVKVRADNLGKFFISDLKSTTGSARSQESMEGKIEYYEYELSAALYLDMFNLMLNGALKKFVWIFASKDQFNSMSYKSHPDIIRVGRAKYIYALKRIADLARNNWNVVEYVGEIRPSQSQMRWLRESKQQRDRDIL